MTRKILRVYNLGAKQEHQVILYSDESLFCSCGKYCQFSQQIDRAMSDGDFNLVDSGQSVETEAPDVLVEETKVTPGSFSEIVLRGIAKVKNKKIIRQFQFRSSRDAGVIYSTLLYEDGTASCNCPGWTRHTSKDGSRTCKHIISAGIGPVSVSEQSQPTPARSAKHGQPATIMRVVRKFKFEDD